MWLVIWRKSKRRRKKLTDAGIKVSLFIDADREQIDAAKACGAPFIELHTGHYADAETEADRLNELKENRRWHQLCSRFGHYSERRSRPHLSQCGTDRCVAGDLHELNISHAIIGRAVFDGLKKRSRI